MMDIKHIKRIFELLCKANAEKFVLLSEMCKEMRMSKTDFMQFIEDNPKLFSTGQVLKNPGKPYQKNSGLAIKNVYLDASENPTTDEWLNKMIEEKKTVIHVDSVDNYGNIMGYYLTIDNEKYSKNKEYIWRNTQEKLNYLKQKGIVGKRKFVMGFFGDCGESVHEYAFLYDNWKEELKKNRLEY